jgi:hypothetical protein
MPLQKIDLFGTSNSERFPAVSTAKLTNMYLEQTEESGLVAYQMPGLTTFIEIGTTPIRGLRAINDNLYVVSYDKVYLVTLNGVTTELGTIDSTIGRVELTDNGTQLFIATPNSGYIITLSTNSLAVIASAGYPNGTTAQFNSGFFLAVKPNSMQFYISSLYDGTTWDALDYASAEASPDNLVACVVSNAVAIMFGERTTEFWANNGQPVFPYAPNGLTAEWGLAARWSIAKFDTSLMYLAKNSLGDVQIVRLEGYKPARVSTTSLEAIINTFTTISDATALTYLYKGHPFYQISFPTAGRTFCFDGLTNAWTELVSYGLLRSIGEQAIVWGNEVYITDYRNGKLYRLDGTTSFEGEFPIIGSIISKHFRPTNELFTINGFQVEFSAGLPASDTDNPQIGLQVSRDNGNTWGNLMLRPLGKLGEYLTSARWSRLGSARSFTFKITISDAVDKAIIAAYIE